MSADINDRDVADALNAIDNMGNISKEAYQPAEPVPISSLVITNDPQCNNNDLKAILLEVLKWKFLNRKLPLIINLKLSS